MSSVWLWVALPFLLVVNAFLAAAQYALSALRNGQSEELRQQGHLRTAAALDQISADLDDAVSALQAGGTLCCLLLGLLGTPLLASLLLRLAAPLQDTLDAPLLLTLALTVSLLLILLITEALSHRLPRILALQQPLAVARNVALPTTWLLPWLWPLLTAMKLLSRAVLYPLGLGAAASSARAAHGAQDIAHLATEAAAEGLVTPREHALILNTLALGRRAARQIMVPRTRVAHLDLQWSMEENRRVIDAHLYSRLPVCNNGLDHIVGVVHTKEFLSAYHAAGESSVLALIAGEAVFAPETVTLERLLGLFHEKRTQLIFLVDEYGGVAGIVTLRDVVDELVLELATPAAPAGEVGQLDQPGAAGDSAPAKFRIAGDMPVHELGQRLGLLDWGANEGVVTVGGLIIARLGRVPQAGETLEAEGAVLHVLQSDGRVVLEIEVDPAA